MAGISNRTIGLITILAVLLGAWILLKFVFNVIVWPIFHEIWFPVVIMAVVVLLFMLFRKKR
jgi:hypothetical protein